MVALGDSKSLSDLTEFADALTKADSAEQAWCVFRSELEKFGVHQGLYSMLPTIPKKSLHDEILFFSSYDQGFLEAYEQEKCFDEEWSTNHCLNSTEIVNWSDPRHIARLSERQIEIEGIGWDFGLHEGLTILLRGPIRTCWGGVGLSADGVSQKDWARTLKHYGVYIVCLAHAFNEHMLRGGLKNYFGLSPREKEVLKWLVCGLSKHEIADKLNISSRTAEVHIYRIRKKLNCANDVQVTAKALVFNLVD